MNDNIYFLKSVYDLKDLPKLKLPEILLCGRSNVGKSSFINSFFNKKNLAKVSSTPGKTRSINFYSINDDYYIVDLPGFGYAKTSQKEQEQWSKLIERFIFNYSNVKLIFHFIDSRHLPTKLDILFYNMVKEVDCDYNVILNKIDKINQSELTKLKKNILTFFGDVNPLENIFYYSAINGKGKKEIQHKISQKLNLK